MQKISSYPCVNLPPLHFLENRSADFLEDWLGQTLDKQSPFVLFKPPGEPYLKCLTSDDRGLEADGREFVFTPFDQDAPNLKLINLNGFQVEWTTLTKPDPFQPIQQQEFPDEKKNYIRNVEKIQTAIETGEVTKVVLSRAIRIPVKRDPWSIYIRLLFAYPNAYCYWWFHPQSGHWMGATPEVLLSANEEEVQVMSLAGTRAADVSEKTEWSEKERDEQEVVTRYVEEVLSSYGTVSKTGPITLRAGNLVHLKTLLKIPAIKNIDPLLTALHPTPAVCGFPSKKANDLIKRLEYHEREYYTGYLGLRSTIPDTSTQLYVNLRCMKWTPSEVTIFVGGGITHGSNAESEWQETIAKSRTLLDVLDITTV